MLPHFWLVFVNFPFRPTGAHRIGRDHVRIGKRTGNAIGQEKIDPAI